MSERVLNMYIVGIDIAKRFHANKRKIIALLDRIFPEYEKLFSDIFGKSSLELLARVCSHYRINNQSKSNKTGKYSVKLIITSSDSTKPLQTSEQSLYLVASLVKFLVIVPLFLEVFLGRNYRLITERSGKLTHLFARICSVHQKKLCLSFTDSKITVALSEALFRIAHM